MNMEETEPTVPPSFVVIFSSFFSSCFYSETV